MRAPDTNHNADELALHALAWTLAEPNRGSRLLDTTGLSPAALRSGAGEPAVLAAVLAFLEAHEPDLVAAATDLGTTPQALVSARRELEGLA